MGQPHSKFSDKHRHTNIVRTDRIQPTRHTTLNKTSTSVNPVRLAMPAMSTKPVKPFKPAKRAAPASPTGLTRLTKQAKLTVPTVPTAPTAPTVLAVCQLVTWHNNAGLARLTNNTNNTNNTHNTLIPIRLYQIERITKPIKVNMRLLAWMDTPSSAYQFMCL
jgi:hypothetical protein